MMFFKRKSNYFILAFIFILVIVNVYIISQRESSKAKVFTSSVPIGTEIDFPWAQSDKEILFIYFKPTCPACMDMLPYINDISTRYNEYIKVIGLCTKYYYEQVKESDKYNFDFMLLDVSIHDALHLAHTPQVVMINNKRVSFAFKINADNETELKRLLDYVKSKYDKAYQ